MIDLLILHDERMRRHQNAPDHPEAPARLQAIEQRLAYASLPRTAWRSPEPATRADLLRAHSSEHVAYFESLRGKSGAIDGDTGVSPGSVDAAYLSAGGAIAAVDAVCNGEARHAFSLGRPPGHHAEHARMMGFCLVNNIAVAARWAIERYDLSRVLIIDWDVHHGNGTQDIFYDDPRVLFLSTHQSPLYPGTGAWTEQGRDAGHGLTVNLPLPAGFTDGDISFVFDEVVRPIALSWEPELILVSAGFDAHRDDPLAGLNWTARGFARLTAHVDSLATDMTNGRFALVLEGGYDLYALSSSVLACCEVLTGTHAPTVGRAREAAHRVIEDAGRHYRWRWPTITSGALR